MSTAMARSKTSSFIFEAKLLTSAQDEEALDRRMECVRRIKIQLVRHAIKQIRKLRSDKRFREAFPERQKFRTKEAVTGKERRQRTALDRELSDIRLGYGLSQYQFKLWVQPLQHRYAKYIDSRTAQCVADDIWAAADKVLFGKGKALRFPGKDDILSVESNDNTTGIRFRKGRILWKGLSIQVQRARHGTKERVYEDEVFRRRVKYCRIVRKQFPGRWHYYVQLVMEGIPPKKHETGCGRVGIDPGTMSAAAVSAQRCILTALDEGVTDHSGELRRLARALDRSRRADNPGNYNEDGTVRKGRRSWVYSKGCLRLQRKKRALERKRAASLKAHHEQLADEILALGDDIYTEEMNYRALQRRAKETTVNSRGRFNRKKRFGRSLENGAPALLLRIIDRKLHYEGHELHKVDTRSFRASQYDHTTDGYEKKHLSRRHNIIRGRWVQRDLYSAFLLMNSAGDLTHADRSLCIKGYDTFLANHDRCIADLINSNCRLLGSFGIRRPA